MSNTEFPGVREEYFEDNPTGIEREEEEYDLDNPWDPNKIRVTTKQFSIRHIIDQIRDNDVELAPDFQRNQVWKPGQKSRLIESLLLQIPLPAFYFAETGDGQLRVVDGMQRLSTIRDFYAEQFPLTELEYLTDAKDKRITDLSTQWRRRIDNTQIFAHVIDPTTPTRVTYDIFKRINTGGTPLKPQEIRHCMSRTRSREFLKSCVGLEEFQGATGGSVRNSTRMDDRELALRYCAFRLLGIEGYEHQSRRSMDVFLMDATDLLDDEKATTENDLTKLRDDFKRSMSNCAFVFGQFSFRKWFPNSDKRNPINKAIFDAWSIALTDVSFDKLALRKDTIAGRARELLNDQKYFEAVSIGTGDPQKVRIRFEAAAEVLQGE